jgi:chromosome segregation ATPase
MTTLSDELQKILEGPAILTSNEAIAIALAKEMLSQRKNDIENLRKDLEKARKDIAYNYDIVIRERAEYAVLKAERDELRSRLDTAPNLHNGNTAEHWNKLAVMRYQENCVVESERDTLREQLDQWTRSMEIAQTVIKTRTEERDALRTELIEAHTEIGDQAKKNTELRKQLSDIREALIPKPDISETDPDWIDPPLEL